MPWVPNPLYLMVGEWLLRNGMPVVLRRLTRTPPVAVILFEGEAKLEHGPENVVGLLSVTPSTLVFAPRALRTRGTAAAIPLAEVEDIAATRGRLFGLIPFWNNGIKVRTKRGIFRFRVDSADRPTWMRELHAAWANAQRAAADAPAEG